VVALLLKKLLLTLFFILIFSFSAYSADEPSLSAHSAILINAQTKEIIYEKNAREKLSMASTTKIMTAILAIESGRLSEVVTAENMQAEGSSIGLENGNKLTLETLVWGMMLESGNDAARLSANFLAGDEKAFSVLMNEKAETLGMYDTNFVTASGLDSEHHYSTAYDMALLGAYATDNPIFRNICSTKRKTVRFIEPDISKTFSNHNKLLTYYDSVIGIKTGFTKKSGRCLVSACERNGIVLVAVTLNAGDDWNDHMKLFDYGFDVCENKAVFIRLPDSVKVYGGCNNFAEIGLVENPVKISIVGNTQLTQKIYIPKFIYAPVRKGDIIGKVQLLYGDLAVFECSIIAKSDIEATEPITEKESVIKRIISDIKEFINNRKD
jgi:D-alanyl-D-alanine carboxypeptidase/D-alanyl-D-alanine carboxypeptidase (penicillin-binding protein 5/6)